MKVLHLIGGGDVGGAKTHVLSLVKELGQYIDVKIVSFRPGMFSDDAKELDIDIEVVKSGNIFKDIKRVAAIVRSGDFQIIHSHGAKANMIALAVKALTKTPTITTVHSDYQLDYMHSIYKRLTFGAINTIALRYIDNYIGVSANFTDMLIDRNFNPERIYTLYNGIDFNKQLNNYSREAFISEHGLSVDKNDIIVGIAARLYPVKGLETLLKAAKTILSERSKTQPRTPLSGRGSIKFIIGGDGEDRHHLEAMNKSLGLDDVVFFAGWLNDPYQLMSIVDISVLTSISESFPYSILEGARFSKATISTRVGGIPDLIRDDVDGLLFEPGDYSALSRHILRLAEDEELRRNLGESLHKRAKNMFSLENMAQTQINIYKSVLESHMDKRGKNSFDMVISGYYGFNNIGDDAMLMGIVQSIKAIKPVARLAILSKAPKQTRKIYRVNSFHRMSIFKVIRIIRKSKLFAYGGGNLIQDSTSTRSLLFYLTITMMATFMKTKVMFYANGIGPLIKPFNRKTSGRVLNRADVITVREELSLRELERLNVTKPHIWLTADPALMVTPVADEPSVDRIFNDEGIPADGVCVGFSVRDYPVESAAPDRYLLAVAKAADKMVQRYGVTPVFIPMEYPRDVDTILKVTTQMSTTAYILKNRYNVQEILGVISRMKMMVAMRLHALIFAANLNIPVISIEYQPKIEGFINYIGQTSAGKMETLEFENLFGIMENVWKNLDSVKSVLAAKMQQLRDKAVNDARIAVNLIEGTPPDEPSTEPPDEPPDEPSDEPPDEPPDEPSEKLSPNTASLNDATQGIPLASTAPDEPSHKSPHEPSDEPSDEPSEKLSLNTASPNDPTQVIPLASTAPDEPPHKSPHEPPHEPSEKHSPNTAAPNDPTQVIPLAPTAQCNISKINITGVFVSKTDIAGAADAVAAFVKEKRKRIISSNVIASNPSPVDAASTPAVDTAYHPAIDAANPSAIDTANPSPVDTASTPAVDTANHPAIDADSLFVQNNSPRCFRPAVVCTPNAEIMMEAQRDEQLLNVLNTSDLVIADGAGVVLASKILGYKSLKRTPGFDLVNELLTHPSKYPYSFYFLGGKPGVAESAAVKLTKSAPGVRIVGYRDGYFSADQEADIIEHINKSDADILLVALGAPKQEKWIHNNLDCLTPAVCIGVGGSLDVLAGVASLAPKAFRSNGLEWLYRLVKEPRRFRRMLRLPAYILYTLCWKFQKGKKLTT